MGVGAVDHTIPFMGIMATNRLEAVDRDSRVDMGIQAVARMADPVPDLLAGWVAGLVCEPIAIRQDDPRSKLRHAGVAAPKVGVCGLIRGRRICPRSFPGDAVSVCLWAGAGTFVTVSPRGVVLTTLSWFNLAHGVHLAR
jgi:hypothetical protein